MPVGDNTPYNVNRKVATFNDYCDNLPSEKEDLDKIKRTTIKNDTEMKQVPGNRTHKFNRVTRKIDDLSPAEINDKIDSIESIEEAKRINFTKVAKDYLKTDEAADASYSRGETSAILDFAKYIDSWMSAKLM